MSFTGILAVFKLSSSKSGLDTWMDWIMDLTEGKRHRVMVRLQYWAGRNRDGRIVMHPSRRGNEVHRNAVEDSTERVGEEKTSYNFK